MRKNGKITVFDLKMQVWPHLPFPFFFSLQNIQADKEQSDQAAKHLSQSLGGVTVVQKGSVDIITNGEQGNIL